MKVAALTPSMLFDTPGIRLNGPKAAGKKLTINVRFTDLDGDYVLAVEHGVLNHFAGRRAEDADLPLTLTRAALNEALMSGMSLEELANQGKVEIDRRVCRGLAGAAHAARYVRVLVQHR